MENALIFMFHGTKRLINAAENENYRSIFSGPIRTLQIRSITDESNGNMCSVFQLYKNIRGGDFDFDYRKQLEVIKNDPASKRLQEIGYKTRHPEPEKVYKQTDAGNAEMLADMLKGQYLYVPEQKSWYRYDGKVWTEDVSNNIVQDVIQCLRQAQKEAVDILDDDKRAKTLKWLLTSESQAKISAALNLMATYLYDCKNKSI